MHVVFMFRKFFASETGMLTGKILSVLRRTFCWFLE